MTSFSKYETIVVRFPFASSIKYKARPAVVISSDFYNNHARGTLLIMAISSNYENRLDFEEIVSDFVQAGLLKKSIFKASVATIEKSAVIEKLGVLTKTDSDKLDEMIRKICVSM